MRTPFSRCVILVLASLNFGVAGFCGEMEDAIKNHDPAKVAALLKSHPELVSEKDETGMTPLHWAARTWQVDIAKLLLANGADAHAADNQGQLPLRYAFKGEIRTVLYDATYPVHVAVRGGYLGKVIALLKDNPNLISSRDDSGTTPLLCAAQSGEADMVKFFLDHKVDVNEKDDYGRTALHWATLDRHKNVVVILLARKADITAKDKDGNMALHLASGDKEITKLLLANGADVNARGEFGQTPLIQSVSGGSRDVAELLIASGADVNAKDDLGFMPLHIAAENGNKEMVELLLAKKADINAVDGAAGLTPLGRAVNMGRKEMAEFLMKKGVKYNFKEVIFLGDIEKVKALLKENPNLVFDRDEGTVGVSPLLEAISDNHKEIAELLLANKADVNVLDDGGMTPLRRAESWHCSPEILDWLRQHGGHE